ncbi:hypothetical protein P8452_42876 [Trifolium repens]|nr:hypothetical protein P8452_42876 [Trifolium repens]
MQNVISSLFFLKNTWFTKSTSSSCVNSSSLPLDVPHSKVISSFLVTGKEGCLVFVVVGHRRRRKDSGSVSISLNLHCLCQRF